MIVGMWGRPRWLEADLDGRCDRERWPRRIEEECSDRICVGRDKDAVDHVEMQLTCSPLRSFHQLNTTLSEKCSRDSPLPASRGGVQVTRNVEVKQDASRKGECAQQFLSVSSIS